MKISFLKKIALAFTAFAGIFVMASCQSAGHDAKFPTEQCSVSIVEETRDGKVGQYADVIIAIDNNTIYNINEIEYNYTVKFNDGRADIVVEHEKYNDFVLRHGVKGYVGYRLAIPEKSEFAGASSVVINHIDATGYQSLWQTYLPAFIVGICLASISILLFAIELFRKGLSKVELKEMFNAHIFSELTILGLVLVICLIPLIFSSWVTTVILLGAFVASILGAGLLTLIRMSTAK